MNNVTAFEAVTLLIILAIGNFGGGWARDVSDYEKAFEHTYFQAWALLLAWAVWREPCEKPQRRGQGPGWCD